MINKYESIDTIVINYTDAPADIQYIECYGTLKREEVSTSSGTVRSSEVFGRFQLPEIGKRFNMTAEPFDKSLPKEEAIRMVSTSIVKRVEQDSEGLIHFWTENSKYILNLKQQSFGTDTRI